MKRLGQDNLDNETTVVKLAIAINRAIEVLAKEHGVKFGAKYPLIPRAGIYLEAHGYGDDLRFARLFRATWASLPLSERRDLLKYWRHEKPTIEMLSDWASRYDNAPDGAYGQCRMDGRQIRFWADAVDIMPDNHIRTLVAHELMHAWLFAKGRREESLDEWCVREYVMDSWGYDEHGLNDWLYTHQVEFVSLNVMREAI